MASSEIVKSTYRSDAKDDEMSPEEYTKREVQKFLIYLRREYLEIHEQQITSLQSDNTSLQNQVDAMSERITALEA